MGSLFICRVCYILFFFFFLFSLTNLNHKSTVDLKVKKGAL